MVDGIFLIGLSVGSIVGFIFFCLLFWVDEHDVPLFVRILRKFGMFNPTHSKEKCIGCQLARK